jgi:hypothetical protein
MSDCLNYLTEPQHSQHLTAKKLACASKLAWLVLVSQHLCRTALAARLCVLKVKRVHAHVGSVVWGLALERLSNHPQHSQHLCQWPTSWVRLTTMAKCGRPHSQPTIPSNTSIGSRHSQHKSLFAQNAGTIDKYGTTKLLALRLAIGLGVILKLQHSQHSAHRTAAQAIAVALSA